LYALDWTKEGGRTRGYRIETHITADMMQRKSAQETCTGKSISRDESPSEDFETFTGEK